MKRCECCYCNRKPLRLMPKELLTAFTDEEWLALWKDGSFKPFEELPTHIQAIPGVKEMYEASSAQEL